MGVQPMISDEERTPIEVANTHAQPVRKWRLLVALAFLFLVEIGGTFLLCCR